AAYVFRHASAQAPPTTHPYPESSAGCQANVARLLGRGERFLPVATSPLCLGGLGGATTCASLSVDTPARRLRCRPAAAGRSGAPDPPASPPTGRAIPASDRWRTSPGTWRPGSA